MARPFSRRALAIADDKRLREKVWILEIEERDTEVQKFYIDTEVQKCLLKNMYFEHLNLSNSIHMYNWNSNISFLIRCKAGYRS